ncbi:MAG: peroxidase family protein [Pirellulaceae bacterium]
MTQRSAKCRARNRTRRKLSLESLEARALLASDLGLTEFASIDGSGNNVDNPEWGSVDEQLLRITSPDYGDGVSTPAGDDRPSAREVSNAVVAQTGSTTNDRYLTDITWLWGQFVDHDIDLTGGADPAESFPIAVPTGDPFFDPTASGDQMIDLSRSIYDETTGDTPDDPRQQINQITAFLDGSVVYGSDDVRASELRTFEGGHLKTSDGDLLPFNEAGLDNAGGPSSSLFLAGDVRANENALLTSMHTVWVREHNRLADELAADNPSLSDEELYQQARALVVAEIQVITYNEYLPALLGFGSIAPYTSYDAEVDPGIANIFSTAAYRFGHSMLSSELLRLGDDDGVIAEGNLSLSSAFFAPHQIYANGIDSLLRGAAAQQAQEIDTQIVDDVRNFLFGPPGAGGFDLASLNIQRGRDHGLPSYNQAREDLGLARVSSFDEITSSAELAAKLEALYGDVDDIDAWVGGLAEDHLPGSSVGELIHTVLVDQFTRIRDGDRFWYQNVFSGETLRELESTTLADVLMRNTDITNLQDNVFFDSSVLYYKASAGPGPSDLAVVISDATVEIVNVRSGEVLESRALGEVSQVMLIGSDRQADNFTVDVRTQAADLPQVVLFGGAGLGDRLTLRGTTRHDDIVVDGRDVTINDLALSRWGFELLTVAPSRGRDDVQIVDSGGTQVIVADGPRHDGGGGRHDRPRHDAPGSDGPRHAGPGRDGPRREAERDLQFAALDDGPMMGTNLNDALDLMAQDRGRPPAPRGARRG